MRSIHIISLLSLLLFAACQKKDSTASITPVKADSVKAALLSTYPHIDTFYGAYHEYNGDMTPYNFSGYSTVLVHYISADSIIIDAQSIGIPHGNMDYPANIYVPTHTNATNSYTFSVRWYSDRLDSYTCTLSGDSLHCNIQQTTACAARDGAYYGYYSGFR